MEGRGRGANSFTCPSLAWPSRYCQQTKYEAKRTADQKVKKRKQETDKQEKRKSRRNMIVSTEYKARQD